MPETYAIEIDRLSVRFDSQWILRNFSLQLAKGEKVSLTGASGSGKSTILRCVLGLVMPEQGNIRVLGQPLNANSIWGLRQQLAYVAQEPDMGRGTARDVIHRPFEYKANIDLRRNLQRLPEMMERFNLSSKLLDKDMSALSGGEKQRIALVSTALLDRPIVLLDEASSALDQENKQSVAAFFQEATELTVLSVSHDAEWQSFSQRTIELPSISSVEEEHHE